MKIFNKYHEKRTLNWYFQWGSFTRYEKQVVSLEFHFPTPKDKSLFFGFTLFTFTLFFFEIAWVAKPKSDTYEGPGE